MPAPHRSLITALALLALCASPALAQSPPQTVAVPPALGTELRRPLRRFRDKIPKGFLVLKKEPSVN